MQGFVLMRCVMHVRPGPDPVWSNRCVCILGLFQRLDTMVWPMSRPMPWGATTNSLHGPGHGHQYVSWSLPLGAVSVLRYTLVACDLRSSVFFSSCVAQVFLLHLHMHAVRRRAIKQESCRVTAHGYWHGNVIDASVYVTSRPDFVRQSVFNLWQQAVSIWPANMVACLLHDVRMLNEASAGSLSDDPSLLLLGARHL